MVDLSLRMLTLQCFSLGIEVRKEKKVVLHQQNSNHCGIQLLCLTASPWRTSHCSGRDGDN